MYLRKIGEEIAEKFFLSSAD